MQVKPGYLKILLASFIWGTMGAFARWSGMSPLELSFFRLVVAGLSLSLILPRRQPLNINSANDCLLLCLCGVLFAVDCLLFFHALRLTTLSNAVFPYSMQPVFIAVLSPLFFKEEKPDLKNFLAFALSFTGLGILLFPAMASLSYSDLGGVSLALGGAFLLSIITLLTRALRVNASTFVLYEMLVAALCLMPFMTPLMTPLVRMESTLSGRSLTMVIIIGLVHTSLAYILYYDGLKTVKMQYGVTLAYFAPVVASLTGFFFFQEAITVYTVAGGLLIVINGLIVIFKS